MRELYKDQDEEERRIKMELLAVRLVYFISLSKVVGELLLVGGSSKYLCLYAYEFCI